MSKLAIGIIETVGLAACIEAADTCVKSANVNLIGYELSKGGGMAVLKIEGNVGAVKAAIDAARVSVSKVTEVFAYKVIPRPSEGIGVLIKNKDTVGYIDESKETKEIEAEKETKEEEKIEETISEEVNNIEVNNLDFTDVESDIDNIDTDNVELDKVIPEENNETLSSKIEIIDSNDELLVNEEETFQEKEDTQNNKTNKKYTCNLCKDPNCKRQKGELKTSCIHYQEYKDFKEE